MVRVITSYLLYSLLLCQLLCDEAEVQAGLLPRDEAGEEDLISRLLGLPGVWWPHNHILTSGWSLLAAGLSSVLLGSSLLPQTRTSASDLPSERVFRGVVARPNSWPWIAKLKVTR